MKGKCSAISSANRVDPFLSYMLAVFCSAVSFRHKMQLNILPVTSKLFLLID